MSQRIVSYVHAALVDKQGVDLADTLDCEDTQAFVVTGGSLTYKQDTDSKLSGKIDITAVSMDGGSEEFMQKLISSYVLIYINGEDGGGRKLIATLLPSVKSVDSTKGYIHSGSVELKSTLCALTENKVRKTSLKKGTNIYKKFCQYAKNYACDGLTKVVTNIDNANKNETFKKNKVFQSGTTVFEIMNYMARLMGAYITVNNKGQIYLKSKRTVKNTHAFDAVRLGKTKKLCMTSTITVDDNGVPLNRLIATFEKTENKTTTRYYSKPVVLSADNPYSRQHIGRNITDIVKVDEEELKDEGAIMTNPTSIKNKLTRIAKRELLDLAEYNYSYTFKCPYVDEINLNDYAAITLQEDYIKAKIKAFDIDLGKGCEMTLTCNSAQEPQVKYQTGTTAKY